MLVIFSYHFLKSNKLGGKSVNEEELLTSKEPGDDETDT